MTEQPVFSVSEFIEYINLAVGRRVTVEGEISGYSVNHGKWVFFDLKDENGKVGCFAAAWNLHTVLEDGMQVQVTGTPRVYPKSGKFSIMVEAVELKGVGALKRAFELTKAKLEKEGIFDTSRKRPLEALPEKIGLICSRESAAYTDFMRILNQRIGGLEVHLAHVHVQGESAVREIVGAFEWFNAHGEEAGIQTLVLVRGGGSLEDLQAFNSEPVARAVFASRIPVICGVGHERDESLADYAADVRAATPTHEASLAVPDREELSTSVDRAIAGMTGSLEYALEWTANAIDRGVFTIESRITGTMRAAASLFGRYTLSLSLFEKQLSHFQTQLTHAASRLAGSHENSVLQTREHVQFLERSLANMNPLTVLKRGYAIVSKKGRSVGSKSALKPGDRIDLRFRDGELPAVVDSPQQPLF